jgi:hypothetical protein
LGLPEPDPFVRGTDPDPDSRSFYHQAKILRKQRRQPVAVLRILLPDQRPDPLVKDMDPDPDPSIIKQKNKKNEKNVDSYCFVTSL